MCVCVCVWLGEWVSVDTFCYPKQSLTSALKVSRVLLKRNSIYW